MWSACGAYYVSTWGLPKNAGTLAWVCVCFSFNARQHHIAMPVYIYIYVPERYAGHRHYWNRVAIYSYLRAESASRAK